MRPTVVQILAARLIVSCDEKLGEESEADILELANTRINGRPWFR